MHSWFVSTATLVKESGVCSWGVRVSPGSRGRSGSETRNSNRSRVPKLTASLTMDEETFLDDEIYDDDGEYHPVDDVGEAVDVRAAVVPTVTDDNDSDGDLDIGTLGTQMTSMDIAPASCFTPAHLSSLAACSVTNLHTQTFLEMRADAAEEDLSSVGEMMPGLAQLRLNQSIVPSMRCFGSSFQNLKVLWVARSELRDLDGIAALINLTELYASFNDITDVAPIAELDFLTTLDLEGNRVEDTDAPDFLNMCPNLVELNLEGNPLSRVPNYRNKVCVSVKRLEKLDDVPVTDRDRVELETGSNSSGGDGESDERVGGDEKCLNETLSSKSAQKPKETKVSAAAAADFQELDTIMDGIKYCAVGIDDPDAVTTRDETTGELSVTLVDDALGGTLGSDELSQELMAVDSSNNMAGRPPLNRPHLERPGTARSLARVNSLGASVRGTLVSGSGGNLSRPGTAHAMGMSNATSHSNLNSRPGTAVSLHRSWGSFGSQGSASISSQQGSRPSTAASWSATRSASRPGTANSQRPGTSNSFGSRPQSQERPGTGRSWGSGGASRSRPGTAMSGMDNQSEPRLDSLFWRKNAQKETRAGLVEQNRNENGGDSDDDGTGASMLTMGEGMLVGNPAKLLSRRKRTENDGNDGNLKSSQNPSKDSLQSSGENSNDILTQLRRWKIEMAETFSQFQQSNWGDLDTAMDAPSTKQFVPQPPMAPKPVPPKFAPAPPGSSGGPRRPPGRSLSGRPALRSVASGVIAKPTGPTSGVVLRKQNPRPNTARTQTVDRLVLD